MDTHLKKLTGTPTTSVYFTSRLVECGALDGYIIIGVVIRLKQSIIWLMFFIYM